MQKRSSSIQRTWRSVVANGKEGRNTRGISQSGTGAICRIATNAICTLPDDLGEVTPQCVVADDRLTAISSVKVHLAVVKPFGDEFTHGKCISRVSRADVLSITAATDIAVQQGVSQSVL